MGRICNTEAGMAGCGAADSQERERCKGEIKRDEKVQEWEGSNQAGRYVAGEEGEKESTQEE